MNGASHNPLKVLVIEDDTLTRMTICSTLKKSNCETIEACNGLMGVSRFRQDSPDIVITDLVMPDKAGLETIYAIRTINPAARIVAISSDDSSGLLEIALELGAQRGLHKPFTPAQLVSVIEDICSAWQNSNGRSI